MDRHSETLPKWELYNSRIGSTRTFRNKRSKIIAKGKSKSFQTELQNGSKWDLWNIPKSELQILSKQDLKTILK